MSPEKIAEIVAIAVISVPFVNGLVAGFKSMFQEFPNKYGFVLAIVCGELVNLGLGYYFQQNLGLSIIAGFIAGLIAANLYDAAKARANAK